MNFTRPTTYIPRGANDPDQLLISRLPFLFWAIFMVIGFAVPSHGASVCAELFSDGTEKAGASEVLEQSQALVAEFADLKTNLENTAVLNGRQLDSLNNYFNRAVKTSETQLNLISDKMNQESLNVTERLETLELIQSLYVSYLKVISPIEQNLKWRRILHRPDIGRPDNAFTLIQNKITAKNLFSFYQDLLHRSVALKNPASLEELGVSSPGELKAWLNKAKFSGRFTKIRDFNRRVFENIVHALTESVGITSDSFPLRRGKLYARPEVAADLTQTLRPLDVLADRANKFKLSHMIIPGYYGHVGIYLGTKAQLMEAGLWDHPSIIPYHQEIESGLTMLEAKRTGVRLRALGEYLNTDSVTAFRQKNLTKESMSEKIEEAVAAIGKSFDHNFDLEHKESYFCSKLIYMVFHDVAWPSRRAFGRTAIPPDYIASLSLGEDRAFDPVLVYENGTKVTEDLQSHIERVQRNRK
jgi:hypothetical protein